MDQTKTAYKTIKPFRTFEIKYLRTTNTKGPRVRIKDLNNNKTKIISYDYEFNNIWEIAIKYLNSKNIKITGRSHNSETDLLFTNDFIIDITNDLIKKVL